MKGIELIEWIEKNNLLEKEVYVNGAGGYERVTDVWESEKDGSSVMLDTEKS